MATKFCFLDEEYALAPVRRAATVTLAIDGRTVTVDARDPVAAGGGAGANAVRAPMPGVVVSVEVAVGDSVHPGQTLMVIESMKLQTSIIAERDGVIDAVCFATEATFDKGAELVRYVDAPAA